MSSCRLIIFTLSICLLAACDNSTKAKAATQKATDDTSSERIENFQKQNVNDLSAMQTMIADGVKKKLPQLIDKATLLTEVSTQGNAFVYHFEVKGIPVSVLNSQYWQENIEKNIKSQYCKNDEKMKIFKEFFPDGSIYNYYFENTLIYSNRVTPAQCH